MITYKIDVLQALKAKGYTSYKLRKDKLFSEKTIQYFRDGQLPSWATIDKLCSLLDMGVGDILVFKP